MKELQCSWERKQSGGATSAAACLIQPKRSPSISKAASYAAVLECLVLAAAVAARRSKAAVKAAHQRGVKVVKVGGQQDGIRVRTAACRVSNGLRV